MESAQSTTTQLKLNFTGMCYFSYASSDKIIAYMCWFCRETLHNKCRNNARNACLLPHPLMEMPETSSFFNSAKDHIWRHLAHGGPDFLPFIFADRVLTDMFPGVCEWRW